MADKRDKFDADGMEDMIDKMLKKYGELDDKGTGGGGGGGISDKEDAAIRNESEAKPFERDEDDAAVNSIDNGTSNRSTRILGRGGGEGGEHQAWNRSLASISQRVSDGVEIGSVVRSQAGVTKQLMNVTEGLDELNDDLEEMKRELERIQTKAAATAIGDLDTSETGTGELRGVRRYYDGIGENWDIPHTAPAPASASGSNEWMEEREGVLRIDDGTVNARSWKRTTPLTASYLPGRGRAHIKEDDVQIAHLLTIADQPSLSSSSSNSSRTHLHATPEPPPVCGWESRMTANDIIRSSSGSSSHDRSRSVPISQNRVPVVRVISVDENPSNLDSWGVTCQPKTVKKDGYCYRCCEFPDEETTFWNGKRGWRCSLSGDEALKSARISERHSYSSTLASSSPYLRRSNSQLNLLNYPTTASTLMYYNRSALGSPPSFNTVSNYLQPVHRPFSSSVSSSRFSSSRFLTQVRRRRNSLGSEPSHRMIQFSRNY